MCTFHLKINWQIAVAEQNKLKQTIAAKTTETGRLTKQIDKIEKEKSTLKIELQNATVCVQHIRTELAEKEHECRSLQRALADEEKNANTLAQKVEGIQNEKDHVGAELATRDTECNRWKDKRDLMQCALDRGMPLFLRMFLFNFAHFSMNFIDSSD